MLDVRPEAAFAAGHAPGAAHIPLDELDRRTHELPPKGAAVRLFDADRERLARAAEDLRGRGYAVEQASLAPADLAERGSARGRLWQPSPLLVEALDRIRALTGPAAGRRALDVACGSGREAVWLAMSGWEVDAIDRLPDALERAGDLARRCGVALRTIAQDLKRRPALPPRAYDLVVVFRFLHRPLLGAIGESVVPGGFLVYETFHRADAPRGRQRLRLGRAAGDGELAAAFAGLEPILVRDGVERDGRRLAQLLARRPTAPESR